MNFTKRTYKRVRDVKVATALDFLAEGDKASVTRIIHFLYRLGDRARREKGMWT